MKRQHGIKRIVAQHGLMQETGQHRLGIGGGGSFFKNRVPQIEIGGIEMIFFGVADVIFFMMVKAVWNWLSRYVTVFIEFLIANS